MRERALCAGVCCVIRGAGSAVWEVRSGKSCARYEKRFALCGVGLAW